MENCDASDLRFATERGFGCERPNSRCGTGAVGPFRVSLSFFRVARPGRQALLGRSRRWTDSAAPRHVRTFSGETKIGTCKKYRLRGGRHCTARLSRSFRQLPCAMQGCPALSFGCRKTRRRRSSGKERSETTRKERQLNESRQGALGREHIREHIRERVHTALAGICGSSAASTGQRACTPTGTRRPGPGPQTSPAIARTAS